MKEKESIMRRKHKLTSFQKAWISQNSNQDILKYQIPHNLTYWLRHNKVCANPNCSHFSLRTKTNTVRNFLLLGIEHYGHGLCYDCYRKRNEGR